MVALVTYHDHMLTDHTRWWLDTDRLPVSLGSRSSLDPMKKRQIIVAIKLPSAQLLRSTCINAGLLCGKENRGTERHLSHRLIRYYFVRRHGDLTDGSGWSLVVPACMDEGVWCWSIFFGSKKCAYINRRALPVLYYSNMSARFICGFVSYYDYSMSIPPRLHGTLYRFTVMYVVYGLYSGTVPGTVP